MKDYKIVFSDLDGTLLTREMTVSEENVKAIGEMTKRGVQFVVSSGRTLSTIPKDVMENPDIRYVICSNGTAIYDKAVEKNVYTNYLERARIDKALEIILDYDMLFTIQYNGKCYTGRKTHNHEDYVKHNVNEYFEAFIYETNVIVEDYERFYGELSELEMFTVFFSDMAEYNDCMMRLSDTGLFKLASSARYNLEIFRSDAGKGAALVDFSRLLGVSVENTIAVGDSINDISMVEAAGLGLAVDGSFEELRDAADEVICKNTEHIADYILNHYIK